MQEPVIDVQDLSFAYAANTVIDRASLKIFPGDFIGVFGPNGGGKTTLLKLLLGFLSPSRGKIAILGKSPAEARTSIGYVPQSLKFDRDFPISVFEVVLMGCLKKIRWLGKDSAEVKEQVLQSLEKVGLTHKAKAAFGTLSGGELQRVLIARAIVDEPKILFLDEPTANVDLEAEQIIFKLLAELNHTMTILMVTHDLQTMLNKARRFVLVHHQVSSLAPKEVCEHFALGLYHTPLTPNHLPL